MKWGGNESRRHMNCRQGREGTGGEITNYLRLPTPVQATDRGHTSQGRSP
jgi:hypothetical protein